mmetsp:Transcript_52835/g.104991  ORF Transcript_52835/g.104991 Transcript_52835/m.104991 type:complete len:92 (-) Transcript_52835:76-351(-)
MTMAVYSTAMSAKVDVFESAERFLRRQSGSNGKRVKAIKHMFRGMAMPNEGINRKKISAQIQEYARQLPVQTIITMDTGIHAVLEPNVRFH